MIRQQELDLIEEKLELERKLNEARSKLPITRGELTFVLEGLIISTTSPQVAYQPTIAATLLLLIQRLQELE